MTNTPLHCAVIIGASGAIGRALTLQLITDESLDCIYAFSRSEASFNPKNVVSGHIDVCDETSIKAACDSLPNDAIIDKLIVAIGILHTDNIKPEKSIRDLDSEWLQSIYKINTIGPALIAKHFIPRMPKQYHSVFAILSARVGSIADNHLGGWYGYRASKAALNMILKNLSIETKRSHPKLIIVGLHPGTVDSQLSKPFQTGVPVGKLFSPEYSATKLLDVLCQCHIEDSGQVFAWDGKRIEH